MAKTYVSKEENKPRREERQAEGNKLKKLAQAVTLRTCIQELPGSNPDLETDSACFLLATCFHAGLLLGLFFDTEDGGDVPSKRQFVFNGLHGAISQKTELLYDTIDCKTQP
jgi:hypothetical protein